MIKQKEAQFLVLMAMIALNPERSTSHKVCDWVIENFIDDVMAFDSTFNSDKAARFWIKVNRDWHLFYIDNIVRKARINKKSKKQ